MAEVVHKKTVRTADKETEVEGDWGVERRERVQVHQDHDSEYRSTVVDEVGATRRAYLSKAIQMIWLLAGILETLIGLRFMLKLIAANPGNPFARFVYGLTDLFLWPFAGLTVTPAADNGMVLEISSLIAMIVYAVVAWAVVRLLYLVFNPAARRSVTVYEKEIDA